MTGNTPFTADRGRRRILVVGPLIALCALLTGSCSGAAAQSWQCRAPEGTFADHDIDMPKTATQFTGEMVIRKADGTSRWHPTARVAFNDSGLAESGCHCNGVVATWYPENPDVVAISLSVDGKQTPVVHVPYGKPVKFTLTFAWDGALKLEVGDAVATGQSSTPFRNNLHMSCSTADVDFRVAVAPSPKAGTRKLRAGRARAMDAGRRRSLLQGGRVAGSKACERVVRRRDVAGAARCAGARLPKHQKPAPPGREEGRAFVGRFGTSRDA